MTARVETILQDVRNTVIDGHYDRLVTLLPALHQAEAALVTGELTDLRTLQAEAERTATCLLSALSGVRAARRRVSDVAQATQGLTTYDRDGLKATVPAVIPASRRV